MKHFATHLCTTIHLFTFYHCSFSVAFVNCISRAGPPRCGTRSRLIVFALQLGGCFRAETVEILCAFARAKAPQMEKKVQTSMQTRQWCIKIYMIMMCVHNMWIAKKKCFVANFLATQSAKWREWTKPKKNNLAFIIPMEGEKHGETRRTRNHEAFRTLSQLFFSPPSARTLTPVFRPCGKGGSGHGQSWLQGGWGGRGLARLGKRPRAKERCAGVS